MKNTTLVLLLFVIAFFFSCSDESVKSNYNYIEKFTIKGISPIEINILSEGIIYIWTEPSNYDSLINKKPEIKVSELASLSGNEGNLSNWQNLKYIVTAENGEVRTYSVTISTIVPKKYSFETWSLSNANNGYYIPSDSAIVWSNGNEGIETALGILKIDNKNPENYPTQKTANGYRGNAVLLETKRGGDVLGRNRPLLSGNFFLGKFNFSKILSGKDELEATELGRNYPAKPKSIKGWYKYKEGPGKFSRNGVEESNTRDSCNMHAQFYRSDLPDGRDTTLAVAYIDNSELVIAKAQSSICTETQGDGFYPFELVFEYTGEPDLENYRYKLAITFAASKYGDLYAGKFGSKLVIDEVEIVDF